MKFHKTKSMGNNRGYTKRLDKYKEKLNQNNEISMTLNYYNKNAIEFNEETLLIDFKEKRNILLKYLKSGSHILDLGSGSGRDSKAFIEKGYKVTAMDGSEELCKIASKNIGQEVVCKNFQDLKEENIFDAVWACASIIHIPYTDLYDVIYNISKALKVDGYLYASFKYGDFEGEINGRYFTYLTEYRFKKILKSFKELQLVEIQITKDPREGRENEKWLNILVKKRLNRS